MRILVTGANGFLGRHIIAALRRAGHTVRALVRPGRDIESLGWDDRVEVFRADLALAENLEDAFNAVDVVIHLAARLFGDDNVRIKDTMRATERLLEAMTRSSTRRIVLASSFSVYDWSKIGPVLTEESPILDGTTAREYDGYAVMKIRQEELIRQLSTEHKWELVVLRAGVVWGDGRLYLPEIGYAIGRLHLVIAPTTRMRLTYVENCAEAFAKAVSMRVAIGQNINVVDDTEVSKWRYTREILQRSGARGVRLPVPYRIGLLMARLASGVNRLLLRGRLRLPGLLMPRRYEARFKSVPCMSTAVREQLGWHPRFDFDVALDRAFGQPVPATKSFDEDRDA